MRIDIDITEEQLKDLVITAVEGGFTASWARTARYSPSAGTVTVDDGEHGPRKVSPRVIARGLRLAAAAAPDEGGWAFAAWLKDRIGDAIIADVILQFGVFGEVVYG
jgi:hypothetical protein